MIPTPPSEQNLARIAQNLVDIGAISLEDYLNGHCQPQHIPQPSTSPLVREPIQGNAVTRLHQVCQRVFRSTAPLKFEFIEQTSSKHKQCILTITKPDGAQRSYMTQPIFVKKNDAKGEAARIAIDMGALDFLAAGHVEAISHLTRTSAESSSIDDDARSVKSDTSLDTCVDDIEQCCIDWRAGRVTPRWIAFFDSKSARKQGCALSIQLSPHVARLYLSDPTFDTHLSAKTACAKLAVLEGVLDFIKYGNGQTRPTSPGPSTSSSTSLPPSELATTPLTLQEFYDSLPRPFPESFSTNDTTEINAPGWLNTMAQNARGGKLILSYFFTLHGPPGLHGCILKLDRPGEYKAFLVDPRFLKRSDAKAAACLKAMSEGIGNYIRSISSAVETKITPVMRSFSSSLVYPALTLELGKIHTDLHPQFEYDKERDAFGATLVVKLSTSPASEARRYTVLCEYRSKADAKVAVICHAAEQGVVEYVRFRGTNPSSDYASPYNLQTYDAESSRKRKQPPFTEDVEQGQPKKKKKKKGKRRAEVSSHTESNPLAPAGHYPVVYPSSDQMHGISRPSDMGLPQNVPMDSLCDPSQLGVGVAGGSGTARPVLYGQGGSYHVQTQMYAQPYPMMLNARFAEADILNNRGYGAQSRPGAYGDGSHLRLPMESGPSRAALGSPSRASRATAMRGELEPGEVVSSAESEFSVSSSRNEDEVPAKEQETDTKSGGVGRPSVDVKAAQKGKEMPPVSPTRVTREGPATTLAASASHVKQLMDYCSARHCSMPSFHETQRQGRFHVWIVIGKERFDLPTTYETAEEGRQRVAKQVLARLYKETSG